MSNNSPYCNLIDTNTLFNNKKVYRCDYCGIKVGLDSSDTKMFCFKKIQDFSMSIKKITNPNSQDIQPFDVSENQSIQDIVLEKVIKDNEEKLKIKENENNPNNLCSEQQIETRLSVCRTCEFYKDNSCVLCGCQIVRDANHMNKLAHKDQKCPADKWGPITDE